MKRSPALLAGALLLLSAPSAFGDTFVMQRIKSDCSRARCDNWGENCSRVGYFQRAHGAYSVPYSRQSCNEFGECHFAMPGYPPINNAENPGEAAPKAQ